MLTREQAAESIANTDLALLRTARTRLGRIIGDLEGIERSAYTEAAREAARMARMLAAAIVNDDANKNESVATITRAAYDYCGLAW